MDINMLLYITLIIYIIIMVFGYIFTIKWLYMLAGLLWFIPLTEINNIWVLLISISMMIAHFTLGLTQNDEGGF